MLTFPSFLISFLPNSLTPLRGVTRFIVHWTHPADILLSVSEGCATFCHIKRRQAVMRGSTNCGYRNLLLTCRCSSGQSFGFDHLLAPPRPGACSTLTACRTRFLVLHRAQDNRLYPSVTIVGDKTPHLAYLKRFYIGYLTLSTRRWAITIDIEGSCVIGEACSSIWKDIAHDLLYT